MEQVRESALCKIYANYVLSGLIFLFSQYSVWSFQHVFTSSAKPQRQVFKAAQLKGMRQLEGYQRRDCAAWGRSTPGPIIPVSWQGDSYSLLVLTPLGFVSVKESFPCKPLSVSCPPSDEKMLETQTLRVIHGHALENFIKAAGGKMGSAHPWGCNCTHQAHKPPSDLLFQLSSLSQKRAKSQESI